MFPTICHLQARDDELASQMVIRDDDDSEVQGGKKFELAPSELKSFTRIGSDEDDEGSDDDELSNDDLSETAVAREARHESSAGESQRGRGKEREPGGIGSDEGSDDDELSNDDLSETAVAREARHDIENDKGSN